VSQDQLRELRDLSAVHAFYVSMLEELLGHPVPPHESETQDNAKLVVTLRHWLNLFDLAVTPAMVRDALQRQPQREAMEAFLRIYILKASPAAGNRDKADFLASYLYRNPPPGLDAKASEQRTHGDCAQEFEKELRIVLEDAEVPEPPPEQARLAEEFDYVRQEVEDLRTFNQLTDSGVVQRVRGLKQKLGSAFYHPAILARVASYNAFFGRRFDELFRKATGEIKRFAQQAQEEGASVMSRVEGDVTVRHLAEVEAERILRQDYEHAQEHFREVAKYKKAVDTRHAQRMPTGLVGAAPRAERSEETAVVGQARASMEMEETRIRSVLESLQNAIRAAAPEVAPSLVLRGIKVVLSPAELEAFRSDYGTEKSFRADFAQSFMRMVSLALRIQDEMRDFNAKQQSEHLWKPHAEALACLLQAAGKTMEDVVPLLVTAQQRGLYDKVTAMNTTQTKLKAQMKDAQAALGAK